MRNEPQGRTRHGEKERRRGLGRMDSWMDGALLLLLRRLVACEATRGLEILRFVARYKNEEGNSSLKEEIRAGEKNGGNRVDSENRGIRAKRTIFPRGSPRNQKYEISLLSYIRGKSE